MNTESIIKGLAEDATSLLREMISIPSPSFEEDEVCGHISSWMTQHGISHERIGNNLIAGYRTDPSKPVLMICAHIDTVEPAKGYSFDPYKPDYETGCRALSSETGLDVAPEDVILGLGSNDDGASAVSLVSVYRYFKERPGNAPDLLLVLTCEEERSGKGGMTGLWGKRICSRSELKDGCSAVDYAIVGEPTGMKAATSERGLLVIDAVAEGISGHAARNEGLNALYMAVEDIERLKTHEFERISPRMGKVNLNVTQIQAGSAHNVIPDRCSFVIDIRPTEQYGNEEILDELQKICRSRLTARNLTNRSSAAAESSVLTYAAEKCGIETFSSPTTSDWMRIECDAIKMGPGDSSRSHRKDEYVLVDEIEEGIRTYIRFIMELGKNEFKA